MQGQPSSRRQTRAAILRQLLRLGGVFRPPLAKGARLSEAGPSRLLFNLKTWVMAYTTLRRERSEVSECGAVRLATAACRPQPSRLRLE
jgi:hypothetical protein